MGFNTWSVRETNFLSVSSERDPVAETALPSGTRHVSTVLFDERGVLLGLSEDEPLCHRQGPRRDVATSIRPRPKLTLLPVLPEFPNKAKLKQLVEADAVTHRFSAADKLFFHDLFNLEQTNETTVEESCKEEKCVE